MRNLICIATAAVALVASAQNAPVEITWTMGSNGIRIDGDRTMKYSSKFTVKNISNAPLDGDWKIYFNQFDRSPRVVGEAPALKIELFRPGYYILAPDGSNYTAIAPGDSVEVEFLCNYWFNNDSYRPDGAHFVEIVNGSESKPLPLDIKVPLYNDPKQWTAPGRTPAFIPSGENIYHLNRLINPTGAVASKGCYDILPTPKCITALQGSMPLPESVKIKGTGRAAAYLAERLAALGISVSDNGTPIGFFHTSSSENPEYYRLRVAEGAIAITSTTDEGALNAVKTLISAIERLPKGGQLENVEIIDFPDLRHRGMMLDISRNFTAAPDIRRFIDAIALYKINVFHFHLTDDEGWRLEIPGIPELTEVGARRGLTHDESEFLMQAYTGTGSPSDNTTANGFISRDEFIDIVRYAWSRGVEVVPEIESPGHARAAIVAMKARYNRYIKSDRKKAEEYMMWDPKDKSEYTSAQGYHDNVMNFATEGTYRFMEKVVDEIIAMYAQAGVPLKTIHIGGDEVPDGSWTGSPLALKFLKKNHYSSVKMGAEYYLDRVSSMIASKGVAVGGWQEVAMHHSDEYNEKVAPRFNRVNVWSTLGRSDTIPYSIANNGFPVVLSNVTNLYFDMVYNWHPQEKGLNWGGAVDEFSAWSIVPYNSYRSARYDSAGQPLDFRNADHGKIALNRRSDICGIQAQLFSETIRSFDMVCMYVFPRLFGLAERGWNASPSWAADDDDCRYNAERAQFNLKIGLELPRLAARGINFHLGQPGVKIYDGAIVANSQYPGVVVRYTTDGSEPNADSPAWTAPVPTDASTVKAKSFFLGRSSNTSTFVK